MDQLMQFISASITDMTRGGGNNNNNSGNSDNRQAGSTKPYKCALREDNAMTAAAINAAAAAAAAPGAVGTGATTGQATSANGNGSCSSSCKQEDNSKDVVQQSQVSSTRSPSVLANDIIGPLLLEALDGFLFMVDSMGKIQFISENVTQYLKYTKDDLIGNSIYNLVHRDDYNHFVRSLDLLSKESTSKSWAFTCRMNVKPPGEERDRCYDNMQITAILQPHPSDIESDKTSRCLLACIARRIGCIEKSTTSLGIEKFTTKQDLKGKILACDTSGGQKNKSHSYSKLIGENVKDFCHCNDRQQLLKHHREVISNGSNTSGVYRFRLHENRYVFVQTKSKLFKNPMNGNPEFIMSTHSIVRECNTESELKGSASSCLMKAIIGNSGSKVSKDQAEFTRVLQTPVYSQQQSNVLNLDCFFNDPRLDLDLDDIADDSAFSDIPDLPISSKSTSLSNLSIDKSLASCPGSPFGSNSTMSPPTSVSRSPRSSSSLQQGWLPREHQPQKQGRGRPRSSKKSVNEPVMSWNPACSSTPGVGNIMHGQNHTLPFDSQFKSKPKKALNLNLRSEGSFRSRGASLNNSWDNLYSSPSPAEKFPSHVPKTQDFPDVSIFQQMCRLQKGNRQRSASGSSSWMDNFGTNVKTSNKNAHLLDLLMHDDDEDEERNSCVSGPAAAYGKDVRSVSSMKSEQSDSDVYGQSHQPTKEETSVKKPTNQNAILKQLLSQVDEDSQPFKCDLKLLPAEPNESMLTDMSQVVSADSSAVQSIPLIDSSAGNASSEAEPKTKDDVLLKELLNKDELCTPSRSSSPELLKSLLSKDDDVPADRSEVHSSEISVASTGLSSPVAMEISMSEQLNEFVSSGVKRKAMDVDESADVSHYKYANESMSVPGESTTGEDRGTKRKSTGSSGPSTRNILLAQLLSKQVDSDSMVSVKNLSAIATVTPLMQMLQQCSGTSMSCGKMEDASLIHKLEMEECTGKRKMEVDGFGSVFDEMSKQETDLLSGKIKVEIGSEDMPKTESTEVSQPLGDDTTCLGLRNWADFGSEAGKLNCPNGKDLFKESIVDVEENEQEQKTSQENDDMKLDTGVQSEEDKKILAELEEVLESSRFTMEDLNSMLGLSNSFLHESTKATPKSAINALEEQVLRIDSSLKSQNANNGCEAHDLLGSRDRVNGGQRWSAGMAMGGEMTDLGPLMDFDDLSMTLAGTGNQSYPQIQGGFQKRISEPNSLYQTNAAFDSLTHPLLSTTPHQRQMLRQQLIAKGQLQQVAEPVMPCTMPEPGVEVHSNGKREELFGDYTPISPALQDDVFSPDESLGYPQTTTVDLLTRSCPSVSNYPASAAGLNGTCTPLGQGQSCLPDPGMVSSGRCCSGQVNQFGQFLGSSPYANEMRESGERKRARYLERMNPAANSMMNPAMGTMMSGAAGNNLGMFGNHGQNFEILNQGHWGQTDGGMMANQQVVDQFNRTCLNMMSGSRVNESMKGGPPFYGQAKMGRQHFRGGLNQMGIESMNQVIGNQMNQLNLGAGNQMSMEMNQMNAAQVNQLNVGQMNQMSMQHLNQINVGQINQINVGQVNQINVGQMGQVNMGQKNMGQLGQMNMGQVNQFDPISRRVNAFNSKCMSPDEFSHPIKMNKTNHGVMDMNMNDSIMARSKDHQNHLDFMAGNQPQGMDSLMRNQQRLNGNQISRMNFDPVGSGLDLGCMGGRVYNEPGIMGQVPHPGLDQMNHSLNHPGMGHLNRQNSGMVPGIDSPIHSGMNPLNCRGQQVNRQMSYSSQMHPYQLQPSSSSSSSSLSRNLIKSDHPGFGQPTHGQPMIPQPAADRPILDQISHMGMQRMPPSPGFGSPPELNVEDIYQLKTVNDSDQFLGSSLSSQSVFGDSKPYRMPADHHTLQGQSPMYGQQQCHLNSQPSQDPLLVSPISNHSGSGFEGSGVNNIPASTICPGRSGRQGLSHDAGKTILRSFSDNAGGTKETSTREYIKQELRNMCTARAQVQSLQQQQIQQQQQQHQSTSSSQISSVPGFDDEIPLDVLESINEITKSQKSQKLLTTTTDNPDQPMGTDQRGGPTTSLKPRDPLFFTENSEDPLTRDQFWDPLLSDELLEGTNQLLSFESLFDSQLDSSHVLPKIPSNLTRVTNKSGSILQKLLSDTS